MCSGGHFWWASGRPFQTFWVFADGAPERTAYHTQRSPRFGLLHAERRRREANNQTLQGSPTRYAYVRLGGSL